MIPLAQMKRLDQCLQDLDLIHEDIVELDLDAAIQRVSGLLKELLEINAGAGSSETVDRHYLNERYWVI